MNDFIWCDLSAYNPEQAASFYADVLGWHFEGDAEGYRYAHIATGPVAAIYPMPEFFRNIRMPSFWMSYIQVPSVAQAVSIAGAEGGKVELEEAFDANGRIALIRDPLGAGFTVYEGTMQPGCSGRAGMGLRAGHALHISNLATVRTFYNKLFGWDVRASGSGAAFCAPTGAPVAHIYETPDAERGGFEYWGVTFTVADLGIARERVEACGGTIHQAVTLAEGSALSAADGDGAAFFLTTGQKA